MSRLVKYRLDFAPAHIGRELGAIPRYATNFVSNQMKREESVS